MRETGLCIKTAEGSFTYRVGALIIKDQKLLVAKNKDTPYYTVGGAVEIHETAEEAVIREVFEETGYNLEIDRLLVIQERFFAVGVQKCHEINFFFLMKCSDDFNVIENSFTDQPPNETLHWIPIDELNSTNIMPPLIKTILFEKSNSIEHKISRE